MSGINLVNLINNSDTEFKFKHGLNKRRHTLHKIIKGSEVINVHKKNLKMPGGYASWDLHNNLKRNRNPRHTKIVRQKLKNI